MINNHPILAIEDLTVSFDGFKAVDNLNFYVMPEELRVVIGPNGAGKTTLLDMICGKTRPTSGTIRFDDKDLTRMSEPAIVRAGVGRKFPTPSIYENLSVFENLEISYPSGRTVFGSLMSHRTDEVKDRVQEVAEMIGLSDRLRDEAGLLSHGQKQWLEIGMLVIQDPKLLMLDEPVAGMSVKEREATDGIARTRSPRAGQVVVIEHDMEFVKHMAHKVTVLHQGKLLAEGSMDMVQHDERVIEVYLGH